MSSREEAIKRTGELLLAGWKMLGYACPICSAVLLAKDDVVKCPQCNLPVLTEEEYNNSIGLSNETDLKPESLTTNPPVNDTKDSRNQSNNTTAKLNGEKKSHQTSESKVSAIVSPRKLSRDEISSAIGEKLLQGWTMLGETCPRDECYGTPLMKLGSSVDDMVCVSCSKSYEYDRLGDLVESVVASVESSKPSESEDKKKNDEFQSMKMQDNTQKRQIADAMNFDDSPIMRFDQQTSDDKVSRLISSKLLKGWALIDKDCKSCRSSVPLMRDLNGKDRCVVCDENTSAKHTAESTNINTSQSILTRRIEADAVEESSDDDWEDEDLYRQFMTSRQQESKEASQSNANSRSSTVDHDVPATVRRILEKKLLEVATELETNSDYNSIRSQALLIKELSSALVSVRRLK